MDAVASSAVFATIISVLLQSSQADRSDPVCGDVFRLNSRPSLGRASWIEDRFFLEFPHVAHLFSLPPPHGLFTILRSASLFSSYFVVLSFRVFLVSPRPGCHVLVRDIVSLFCTCSPNSRCSSLMPAPLPSICAASGGPFSVLFRFQAA